MSTVNTRRTGATEQLVRLVGERVAGLQAASFGGDPKASARLARLRRAVTADPGSVPAVWEDTVGLLGDLAGRGDAPNRAERCAHLAICLYALHQQSVPAPMHSGAGISLGAAVRELRQRRDESREDSGGPVLARFHALATSTSEAETAHHLRGLIKLMRDARVPLDYGRLAGDLYLLASPDYSHQVRLRWGRALYAPVRRADPPHDTAAGHGGPDLQSDPTDTGAVTA